MGAPRKNTKAKKNQQKQPEGFKQRFSAWMDVTGKRFHSLYRKSITDEETVESEKLDKQENRRFIFGLILAVCSVLSLLAMVSHLFTGKVDQHLMCDSTLPASNWLGKLGWRVSHCLIDDAFGVSGIMIPLFLLAASVRIMGIFKVRLHKWFINCMIIMIWCSAFFACLSQYIDSMANGSLNWGGNIGKQEFLMAQDEIGILGSMIVLGVTALLYIFYLSEEMTTNVRHIMTRNSRQDQEESSNDEECQEDDNESENEPETNDNNEAVPFADKPEDTATVLTFDINHDGNQDTDNNEQNDAKETSEDESGKSEEIPFEIKESEDATEGKNEQHDGEDMKVVVGQAPEEANATEEGALEPYDPKKGLEYYKYPTLNLLKRYAPAVGNVDMEEQRKNKERIQEVLQDFGVEISSITATVGPTITLYEIKPAPGVRISKIRNLEDDIALSLSALGIRIIAPIPGKGTIGIEVPNAHPQIVSMESIINSRKFQETKYELPIALGKTITNEVYMADLTKLPHLLVAGATGQGKSVGLNAIITSLLYKKHPAELKLVMVDPKKVEFSLFNPIVNHFLAQVEGTEGSDEPVITDVNKVVLTLKSLCIEMDNRYDLLKSAKAKNIKEYNEKFRNRQLNPNKGHRFLPYIVVIIDEFGDLIMTAGKEIELPIARIAQLARAVGIHMIIATQRPTTNIITGTIKANFPARMAFKVSSAIDSKTILDRTGANHLVGKGDMLILNGNEPVRVQCAFVDTPEVSDIVSFIASQQGYLTPLLLPEVPNDGDGSSENSSVDSSKLDDLFEEAAELMVTSQRGSTSYIQQQLEVGFNRAGRIMMQLEKAGIVGPSKGSKPREVLVATIDELQYKIANIKNN